LAEEVVRPEVPSVRVIGYWARPGAAVHESTGWPDPADLVGGWPESDRTAVVRHLRSGIAIRSFSGWATCRLCGKQLGTTDLSDGTWAWPAKLEHYVEAHDVRLPDDFVSRSGESWTAPAWLREHKPLGYSEGGAGPIPLPGQHPNVAVDDSGWLDWAAEHTPARPQPDAASTDAARRVCAELSHAAWRVDVEDAHARWRLDHGFLTHRSRAYLPRCGEATLRQRLMTWRLSDPHRTLRIERANEIASEAAREDGGVMVLANAPGMWFVGARAGSANWPSEDEIRKVLAGPLAFGWELYLPGGCRAALTLPQDEINWRWLIGEQMRVNAQLAAAGDDPPRSP
jgi:hypothetical protein